MPRRLGLLTLTIALLAAACGGGDGDGGEALDQDAVARGVTVYQGSCQSCHGPEGVGVEGLGKPWVNSEFIDGLDDDTGISMMPRGGNPNLTDDDLLDVIAYMRSLNFDG